MLVGLVACTGLFDADRIAAIDVLTGASIALDVGDTLTLRARAVTAGGAIVPDAAIVWRRTDPDTAGPVIRLDSLTGHVTALDAGTARVVAVVERIVSGPVSITVRTAGTP